MSGKNFLTINELSEKTGVNAQTLRNWEKSNLIVAADTFKNHHLFTVNDVRNVKKIVSLREQGYQLKNIKSMLGNKQNTTKKKIGTVDKNTGNQLAKVKNSKNTRKIAIDYSNKSITELTDIAKNKGIKYFRQMNKSELVEALNHPRNAEKMAQQAKLRTKERYGDKVYGKNKTNNTKKKTSNLDIGIIEKIILMNNEGKSKEEILKVL